MIKYILHYAPSKVIPGLINFIGLIIYARIFTQEEYGRYAYVIATIGLIQSFLFPWIRMSCSRFYQKYEKEGKQEEFENFTLYIFLLVSIILTIFWIIFLLVYDMDTHLKKLYILGLIITITQSLYEQLMALARAKLQSKTYAYSVIIRGITRLLVVLLLVFIFNFNEVALFISLILAQVIPTLLYMKKHFVLSFEYFKFNKYFLRETFQYGFPLTFSFILVFIISSSDRILIEYFLGAASVGLYSIPYEFTTFTLTNVFMIFSMAFLPIIVRELEYQGAEKATKRIKQYSEAMFSFTVPCTIIMFFLAPYIAELILGEQYNNPDAILIIRLVSLASFLSGLKAYFFDFSFQLGKNTYAQIIPVIFSAVANVIANIILIPFMGVVGAVTATLIAYIIGIVLSIFIGKKIFPMVINWKQISRIIFINVVLIILLYLSPFNVINWFNLVVNLFLCGFIYFTLMLLLNINNSQKIIYEKFRN